MKVNLQKFKWIFEPHWVMYAGVFILLTTLSGIMYGLTNIKWASELLLILAPIFAFIAFLSVDSKLTFINNLANIDVSWSDCHRGDSGKYILLDDPSINIEGKEEYKGGVVYGRNSSEASFGDS